VGVTQSAVTLRPKLIPELLAAAFDTEAEPDAWSRSLAEVFSRFTGDAETAVTVTAYDRNRNVMPHRPTFFGGDRFERMSAPLEKDAEQRLRSWPQAEFVRYFFPPHVALTQTDLERGANPPPMVRELRAKAGIGDMAGLLLHPAPGLVAALSCVVDQPTRLSRPQRTLLTRVGLHVENAFRLRLSPRSLRGVLTADGKLVHAVGTPLKTDLVGRLERHRADPEERLALWTALVAGQCSLVEREASRGVPRHFLLLDNPPSARAQRELTPIEATVVHDAARGMSGKTIAYSLGLSPASISSALATAAAKLGFTSHVEMLRTVRLLVADPSWLDTGKLSPAENAVLSLLLDGGTNLEIAQRRGTSERTVANQVASILKKTGADSRRALRIARS
jgi:DNA-binding NarL/FixJ family response regulator